MWLLARRAQGTGSYWDTTGSILLQVLGTVNLFLSTLSRFIVFVYLFYWLEIQEVYVLAFSSLLGLQINAEVESDDW